MSNQATITNNTIQSTSKLGILRKGAESNKKNTGSKKDLLPKKKFKKDAASDEEP